MGGAHGEDALGRGLIPVSGGTAQDSGRLHHNTQNLKLMNCLFLGIFHLRFLDHGWPWITDGAVKPQIRRDYCTLEFNIWSSFFVIPSSLFCTHSAACPPCKLARVFWFPVLVWTQLRGAFYLQYPKMPFEFQRLKHN